MKYAVLLVVLAAKVAFCQTPPIQPQTPDIKVPPPLTLPGPTIEAGKQPLDIQEAIAIALKNQPDIAIAQGNLVSAQGRKAQAQSGLYPQFDANASAISQTQLRGETVGTSPSRFSASINIDQLLFDFGRTRDSVRQQSALQRAFEFVLARTRHTVVLDVKSAFYDLLQNHEFVAISEANVANRQKQLDLAQARLDSGLGPPADVVRAKTNLADGVISLESARATELNSRVTLAQQLGIDPRTPITPADSTETPMDKEDDIEALVKTAMENRPDIRESEARVSAAEYSISSASKGNLPRISATASLGARGSTDPFASETGSVGISVSWSFFDSGLTAGRVKEARGQEQVARAQLVQVTQQAVTEVSQAYVDLKAALQRVETARAQVANALELLRISEGRYQGGIGQFLEVTDAQNSIVSAQRNLSQAQKDVARARARLRTAIGTP